MKAKIEIHDMEGCDGEISVMIAFDPPLCDEPIGPKSHAHHALINLLVRLQDSGVPIMQSINNAALYEAMIIATDGIGDEVVH